MDSFYHGYDSCYHVIQSIIDLIHFIIAINMLNEIIFVIDNERFSLVCSIIYKREDSFHLDLLHTIEGIHFIMDGIHSIMVFNPL